MADHLSDLTRGLDRLTQVLSQQLSWRADLAVTGLSRAGKTVFVAALIEALTRLGRGTARLSAFAAAPRIAAVAEQPVPERAGSAPFPIRAAQDAMRAEIPSWPEPTARVRRAELLIRYRRPAGLGARVLGPEAEFRLGIIDYPGEWLLDLPMLTQDYATWSATTLALIREPPRAAAAAGFLGFLESLPPGRAADDQTLERGRQLYAEFLQACRDRHGLCFLQPGRYVLPAEGDAPPAFFPIEPPTAAATPAIPDNFAARLAHNYERYRREIVRPFFADVFRDANRHVVLVDLLAALNGGAAVFADTGRALDAVLGALDVRRGGPLGTLLPLRYDKVLFAVTKADHVPDSHRDRLSALLGDLVGLHADAARAAGAAQAVLALAAVRATEDDRVTRDVGEIDVVVGIPVHGAARVMVSPGKIPRMPVPATFWRDRVVAYPRFRPPAIDPGMAPPHINLDVALEFLLGDLLR
jgi:predicted YcjX-like family ATPase